MMICTNCLKLSPFDEDLHDPCLFCGAVAWRPYTDVRAERIAELGGIDPGTARLLADADSTSEFLSVLAWGGYEAEPCVTGHCPDDGGPMGYYTIVRHGKELGRIDFDCCGIEIPMKVGTKESSINLTR